MPSLKSLLVGVLTSNGQHLGTATAFVAVHASGEYLVTNWHVVSGRNTEDGKPMHGSGAVPETLHVMHNVAGQIGRGTSRLELLYGQSGAPLWLEHPSHGRKVDVVAIPLRQTDGIAQYPYDAANPGPPITLGAGDLVSIIGFPFGRTGGGAAGIWVQGWVATEPGFDFNMLPCFLVDSRTRQGQSGSPVILYRKGVYTTDDGSVMASTKPVERFVGVYSGRINTESDLGIVWKGGALDEILAGQHRGPIPKIGPPP